MKPWVLRLLCCPSCRQPLRLEPLRLDGDDVDSGWLVCSECPEAYRIVRGIPRFVRSAHYAIGNALGWTDIRRIHLDAINGTRETEDALSACTGWTSSTYRGRLVLDLGVGSGRFAEAAARYGAEVVGVDFNATVDVARREFGHLANLHLIQADLSAIPLRPDTFDVVYSMGVLHYTPNPAHAFAEAKSTVKPSGTLAVMLSNRDGFARRSSSRIRVVTTRLPLGVVLAAASMSIPLYYGFRLPWVGSVLRAVCPVSMHAEWRRRWLETFNWYTASYQWYLQPLEVSRWFQSNGFTDVEIGRGSIYVRGKKRDVSVEAPMDVPSVQSAPVRLVAQR